MGVQGGFQVPELTLQLQDFRVHERLNWSPEGVCVLAGANGAGKTTTLDALRFLSTLFQRGHEAAFLAADGVAFRRSGADSEATVNMTLTVGDLLWKLRFPMSAEGLRGYFGEELHRGEHVEVKAAPFQEHWYLGKERLPFDDVRCCTRVLWDRGTASWMQPLVDVLEGTRVYSSYTLNSVKEVRSVTRTETLLHHTGRNLWSILAGWKASPLRYRGQFDWVMSQARLAFPGLIGSVEFDRGIPVLFPPGATDPAEGLPPNRAADGLLTGLLHLTAVAGAKSGSLLAFDEVENHLHPHAIRMILAAMRQQAQERNLTIVLTTHSTVVLNQFRSEPEQVFVLGHSEPDLPMPARMTDLHHEEWLAQARLGSLYEALAFGAPAISEGVP